MRQRALHIFDETLRDGEQQAGLFLGAADKRELARRIARTGVHQIDVMPAMDASEAQLARTLVETGMADRLTPATLLGKEHVDRARALGARRIVLFYALSDRLMFLRDAELREHPVWGERTIDDGVPADIIERMRERTLRRVLESLRHATQPGMDLRVDFAAEDASRADPGFLLECVRAFRPYLEHFLLCDTVGVLRPSETRTWVEELLGASGGAPLGVHFHDDCGLALENTLEAVAAGATLVSGTFGGIGERAGNVALERVLEALRRDAGVEVEGIDPEAVAAVTGFLAERGLSPAGPGTRAARRHESGIHVNALLRDPRSYSIFPDEEPEIWFGKTSGASNFQYLFEKILGRPRPQEEYRQLSAAIKCRSLRECRGYSVSEVIALLDEGSLAPGPARPA